MSFPCFFYGSGTMITLWLTYPANAYTSYSISRLAIVELITAPSKLLYKSLIFPSYKSISITFFNSTTLPTVTPCNKRFRVSFADSSLLVNVLFYFWLVVIEELLRIVDFVDTSFIFFLKSAFVLDIYDPFDIGFGGKYFVLLYFPS